MNANGPVTIPGGQSPDKPVPTPKGKKYVFKDKVANLHVTVTVPDAVGAVPQAGDWKSDFEVSTKPDRRRVINLMFNKIAFSQPVELRVTLKKNEVDSPTTKLVYYDPTQKAWQAFAGASISGNEFVASITQWFDDPGIGIDTV